jgi:hypothetical protein
MDQCTDCDLVFQTYAPVTVSVVYSGNDVLVYVENNGRNIIVINLLLLCIEFPNGQGVWYVRDAGLLNGGEQVEQGWMGLKFQIAAAGATQAKASIQYIEVTGRAVSCVSVP